MVILGVKEGNCNFKSVDVVDVNEKVITTCSDASLVEECCNLLVGHNYYRVLDRGKLLSFSESDDGDVSTCALLNVSNTTERNLRKVFDYISNLALKCLSDVFVGDYSVVMVEYFKSMSGEMEFFFEFKDNNRAILSEEETDVFRDYMVATIKGDFDKIIFENDVEVVFSGTKKRVLERKSQAIQKFCRSLYFKEYPISGVKFFNKGLEDKVFVGLSKSFEGDIVLNGYRVKPVSYDSSEDIAYHLTVVL